VKYALHFTGQLGHDVLTVQEAGEAGQSVPDEHVLAFASAKGRALVTLNRKHFIRLHNVNPEHAGIIVCRFDLDFIGQAHRIHGPLSQRQGFRASSSVSIARHGN